MARISSIISPPLLKLMLPQITAGTVSQSCDASSGSISGHIVLRGFFNAVDTCRQVDFRALGNSRSPNTGVLSQNLLTERRSVGMTESETQFIALRCEVNELVLPTLGTLGTVGFCFFE